MNTAEFIIYGIFLSAVFAFIVFEAVLLIKKSLKS